MIKTDSIDFANLAIVGKVKLTDEVALSKEELLSFIKNNPHNHYYKIHMGGDYIKSICLLGVNKNLELTDDIYAKPGEPRAIIVKRLNKNINEFDYEDADYEDHDILSENRITLAEYTEGGHYVIPCRLEELANQLKDITT